MLNELWEWLPWPNANNWQTFRANSNFCPFPSAYKLLPQHKDWSAPCDTASLTRDQSLLAQMPRCLTIWLSALCTFGNTITLCTVDLLVISCFIECLLLVTSICHLFQPRAVIPVEQTSDSSLKFATWWLPHTFCFCKQHLWPTPPTHTRCAVCCLHPEKAAVGCISAGQLLAFYHTGETEIPAQEQVS